MASNEMPLPEEIWRFQKNKHLRKFGSYSYCFLSVLKRTRDIP
uniref:Uncharacterized protein n=1 Tax=Arundo donax TaxID=35708 RepID=A0A0A8ZBH7_ARUDO